MKVLIAGAQGQLGKELLRATPVSVEAIGVGRADLDIRNSASVLALMRTTRPDVVINAAAFTEVDRAESAIEEAFAVNATGAANIAQAATQVKARVIHISTDYVFDGAASQPYTADARTGPQTVYGRSKLAGEEAIADSGASSMIVRTSWLYSAHGKNFLRTILRLLAVNSPLRIVCDQTGVPTSARDLAQVLWQCTTRPDMTGTFHWTNAGTASWFEFAVEIREQALRHMMLTGSVPIHPIPSSEFPTPAKRPAYSVLDSSGLWSILGEAESWTAALERTLYEIRTS